MVTLTHAVVGTQSTDEYDRAANQTLTVNVSDDDVELSVRPQAVRYRRGSYTGVGTTAPSGPVTVSALTLAVEEDHATARSAP